MSTPELAGRGRATRCDGMAGCVRRTLPRNRNLRKPLRIGALPGSGRGSDCGRNCGSADSIPQSEADDWGGFWVRIGFWRDSLTQMAVP